MTRYVLSPIVVLALVGMWVPRADAQVRTQIAVVVDISESMRDLTEPTRKVLVPFVQQLVTASGDEEAVDLALLAYGYGGDDAVKEIVPLTDDWEFSETGDIVYRVSSEEPVRLSSVFTDSELRGGIEGCGRALRNARVSLEWSEDANAKRIVVIAGNEPFDQGLPNGTAEAREYPVHVKKKLIPLGNGRSRTIEIPMPITLHTIHAGPLPEGRRHEWPKAAALGKGTFENVPPR